MRPAAFFFSLRILEVWRAEVSKIVTAAVVTHLRKSDASEKQLEALAILMGHSLVMQRDTYDRYPLAFAAIASEAWGDA